MRKPFDVLAEGAFSKDCELGCEILVSISKTVKTEKNGGKRFDKR